MPRLPDSLFPYHPPNRTHASSITLSFSVLKSDAGQAQRLPGHGLIRRSGRADALASPSLLDLSDVIRNHASRAARISTNPPCRLRTRHARSCCCTATCMCSRRVGLASRQYPMCWVGWQSSHIHRWWSNCYSLPFQPNSRCCLCTPSGPIPGPQVVQSRCRPLHSPAMCCI